MGEEDFRVQITDGRLEVARGQTGQPDATFDTDPGTLTALLRNDRQLTVALRAGDLRLDGDKATAERIDSLNASWKVMLHGQAPR
jgi:ubiquinone biosynthesis protein UbiJ